MPRLPDKNDLGGLPSGGRRAPALISGVDATGGAKLLQSAAKAIGGVALAAEEKRNEADEYELQKALVNFDLEQEKRLDMAKRETPPEAKDFTVNYRNGYDQAATEFMTKVPDRLKPKVDEILVKRGANYEKRAFDFEIKERDRWNIQDLGRETNNILTRTMSVPDSMEDNAARGIAVIRASKLSNRAKIDAERKFLDMNAEYGVKALIDREIQEGRDAGDIVERLRKAPRGSLSSVSTGIDESLKESVKRFEGFAPKAVWDYKQASVGYGTRAKHPGEVISKEEADKRLDEELGKAAEIVDGFAPDLDYGTRKALISLTYNAGADWTNAGLGKAIKEGDFEKAKALFLQYDKAGGKALPGLKRRRREEASWIGKGDKQRAPDEALPPEGGEPDRPTLDTDTLAEADDAEWTYMSPATRRKLITYARNAGRAVVTKGVDDDIARIRLGRDPEIGPDGKTSLERARTHMTNLQWTKKKQEWDEAQLEYKELSGLRSMTSEEAADHIAGLIDRAEGNDESIRAAARVQKKADTRLKKIISMRDKDPVRFVNGFDGDEPDERSPPLTNTREAMQRIKEARQPDVVTGPDGTPIQTGAPKAAMSPQQQWDMLFKARLADQEEIMPDQPEKHRILSKREAEQLLKMPKDAKGLDYKAYRERLEEAAKRAEAKFGPKYAKRALEEAIAFQIPGGGSTDQKSAMATVIRKMASGESVTSDDFRIVQDIGSVDRFSLSNALFAADRIGRDRGVEPPVPIAGSARPAIDQGVTAPTPAQIEWIRKNPDDWQAFDQMFGRGATARALGGSGRAGGGSLDAPQRDWTSDEKSAGMDKKNAGQGWWPFGQ